MRTASARDLHEEVTERVVEPLDVRQDAHGRMVRTPCEGVHAVPERAVHCMKSAAFEGGALVAQFGPELQLPFP
jgi:hypothetical protein